jgi:hypothetical protein
MKSELKRRDFLTTCLKAGVTCCALISGNNLISQEVNNKREEKPDPKKLNYCGYKCSNECLMYQATLENNTELKKKAYEQFKMKEKYKIDFDPEKIFCWGCKVTDKPLSIAVKACTVRTCVLEKGIDCCIQCDSLKDCKKDLWINYPKFRENVIEMQLKYKSS